MLPWRWLRRRLDKDRDFAHEIEAHLAHEIDDNLARGLPPGKARTEALRKLGNRNLIREEIHAMNSFGVLEDIWQDLRYAARVLRSKPGFTVTAVLSLALGIGANAALFQLLNALVLRSLPVEDPQRLVRIDYLQPHYRTGQSTRPPNDFSNPQWEQMRNPAGPFAGMFAWGNAQWNLASSGTVRFAHGIFVSGSFFPVLGVRASLGRVFSEADDHRGCPAQAVISHGFWQREFGGAPSVLSQRLSLDGHSFSIAGVTSPGFQGIEVGTSFDVAIPMCAIYDRQGALDDRAYWWLGIMGRLKPGVPMTQASAFLESTWPGVLQATISPNYTPQTVKEYLRNRTHAVPGGNGFSWLRLQAEDALLLLLSIAGFVLIIACANLANLLLARASVRQREMAIRLAMGASRWRLVRQLMSESLLLALLGAAAGGVLARLLSRYLLTSFGSTNSTPSLDLSMDWRFFAFLGGLAIGACFLFGLAPALRATRRDPAAAMKSDGRGLTATRERFGLQRILVASQLALSLTLLTGSLLFIRSFRNLMTLDPGFRKEDLVAAYVTFSNEADAKEQRLAFFGQVLDKLRAAGGIESAAMVENTPMTGSVWNDRIFVDGASGADNASVVVDFNSATDGYFRTMDTPLLAGRDFDNHDVVSAPLVAVVDEGFVKNVLGGQYPIGKTFHVEAGPGETSHRYQIVGVVKQSKYSNLQRTLKPTVFICRGQIPNPDADVSFIARSSLPPSAAFAAMRGVIEAADPHASLDFHDFGTMIHDSVRREDTMAQISGLFGVLAVVLATVGLYGVMSFLVAQRRNEIGIRMALGATGREIVRLLYGQSGVLLLAGLAAGAALSLALGRVVKSLLFNLDSADPVAIGGAAVALALVAMLATAIPARRAAKLDPAAVLREE